MKISIYQPKRKDAKGLTNILFVFVDAGLRETAVTGIKAALPLSKTSGTGIGVVFDRKEPGGRAKQKRLEEMYWKLDEYRINHPHARPSKIKEYFQNELSSVAIKKASGVLIATMEEYVKSSHLSESTAAIITRTIVKVREFDPNVGFDIDTSWLDNFSAWLKKNGTKPNGIGLHLRNLRTVFNFARKKGLTKEYPFLDYTIKVERQAIRSMSLQQLRELRDYPCEPWQVEYRDLFMLIFYLAGINIGDLLKCKGLTNGRLIYTRTKTSKPLSIPVYPEAQAIIDKYKGKNFLINPSDRYKDYHGYMHRMNDGLKKIGKTTIVPDKVGKMRKHETVPLFEGLSTYVARYTFASIAAEAGVARDVIAACLGHSWADVTSHYVAYSQKQIDDAIRKTIDYVNNS